MRIERSFKRAEPSILAGSISAVNRPRLSMDRRHHIPLAAAAALLLCSAGLSAAPVTPELAQRAAAVKNSLHAAAAAGRHGSGFSIKNTVELRNPEDGSLIAYVSELAPQGFIVVSADDELQPVIAYSYEHDFKYLPSPKNVLLGILTKDMGRRLESLPFLDPGAKEQNSRRWAQYLGTAPGAAAVPHGTGAYLIGTSWHQEAPYNGMCPMDGSSRSIVGCVATAMSQIVYYHKFPASITLTADNAYTTYSKGITVGDFSSANSMLEAISFTDSTDVPALCFACGVLVEMDYTSSQSGAYFNAEGMKALGYEEALYQDNSGEDFYTSIQDDIKMGRPALMSISGSLGYHAIIVDGHRSEGEYHLNFGWGDSQPDTISSCWYSLPSGMPVGFNSVNGAVTNIISPDTNPFNEYEEPLSYPNPFRTGQFSQVTISLPHNASGSITSMDIYTVAGRLVKRIDGEEFGLRMLWDGRNSDSQTCAAGIYYYVLRTSDEGLFRGKLTVLE